MISFHFRQSGAIRRIDGRSRIGTHHTGNQLWAILRHLRAIESRVRSLVIYFFISFFSLIFQCSFYQYKFPPNFAENFIGTFGRSYAVSRFILIYFLYLTLSQLCLHESSSDFSLFWCVDTRRHSNEVR